MTAQYVPFNINDMVRVKLTPRGRECHRKSHDEIFAHMSEERRLPHTPAKEDEDGWSRWQLWVLMSTFGEYIGHGRANVFEMGIEFEIEGD